MGRLCAAVGAAIGLASAGCSGGKIHVFSVEVENMSCNSKVRIDPGGDECPTHCEASFEWAGSRMFTLTAMPGFGEEFVGWVDAGGTRPCVEGMVESPTLTVEAGEMETEYDDEFRCRALFRKIPFGDQAWATSFGFTPTGTDPTQHAAFVEATSKLLVALVMTESGIADSVFSFVEAAFDKPGRAAPTTARQGKLVGVEAAGVLSLADGALILGGEVANKPWLGRLNPDDSIAWQLDLGLNGPRVDRIALVDAGNLLAVVNDTLNDAVYVAEVTTAGVVGAVTKIPTPELLSIAQVVPTDDGGWLLVANVNDVPDRATNLIRVDGAGAIMWQKTFAGGAVGISRATPLSGGGWIIAGSHNAMTMDPANTRPFVAQLGSDGAVVWSKTYAATDLSFVRAVPTASGFRVVGSQMGDVVVLELGADGNLTGGATYGDGAASFRALEGVALADGGLHFVASSSAGKKYLAVATAPDLTVSGCNNAAVGASFASGTVTVADGTMTVTNATFTLEAATPFTPVSTTIAAPDAVDVAIDDVCSN